MSVSGGLKYVFPKSTIVLLDYVLYHSENTRRIWSHYFAIDIKLKNLQSFQIFWFSETDSYVLYKYLFKYKKPINFFANL